MVEVVQQVGGLLLSGSDPCPVSGMYRLKIAATRYRCRPPAPPRAEPAPGRPSPISQVETSVGISIRPIAVPTMIAATVRPLDQPLATTSRRGAGYSVRMPYLAGE